MRQIVDGGTTKQVAVVVMALVIGLWLYGVDRLFNRGGFSRPENKGDE